MFGPTSVLKPRNVSYLDAMLLDKKGQLRPVAAATLAAVNHEDLRYWCHIHAVYGLPTFELIGWLKERIQGRSAIEIGSGNGCLGRALGIPATDSWMQATPEIQALYASQGQQTITYGEDVERLEALEAVARYHPQVVIGQWVTEWIDPNLPPPPGGGSVFGVREPELLAQVETYILVGNSTIHGQKSLIRKQPPEMVRANWIWSRSQYPSMNFILVWDRR
jgi:hypothetical protein